MFFTTNDPFSKNTKRHNYIIAFLAGILTGIAWWIIIDILVRSMNNLFSRFYILPGIAITLVIIILHFIPNSTVQDEIHLINSFDNSIKCARLFLFLIFLIIFSAVIASIWIFIVDSMITNNLQKKSNYVQWFGIGNLISTILLALASLLSRFGRKDDY
ncbi:hypothetical protein I4U23_029121 [Adineta vaga]|nr:hypothetical protein I4U23_029121 [Adineta vaga]